MKKHKHHIIPKHMGGSNDPSNIVELSIKEHAEAHKKLWIKYGKIEDKIAYECLLGRKLLEEERIYLSIIGFHKFYSDEIKRKNWINKIKEKRKKQIITNKHKKNISKSLKKAHREGKFNNIIYSEEMRNNARKKYIENNMAKKLADSRKKSKKWKNIMTSKKYRKNQRKISKKAKKVSINGKKYLSIHHAVEETGFKYNKLRNILISNTDKNIFFL